MKKQQGMIALAALLLVVLVAGAAVYTQNQREDDTAVADATANGDRYAQAEPNETNERPQLDVPYVPTPQEVVDKMLGLANIQKDDVVYDLGCGDGRIVITAAQRYGVRGVGVDIDPERIRESKANAEKAGVADRVQFFQRDLFKTDISDATVLMMYLLPEINLRLRPKIFRELKPGARIASHAFTMGEWNPDQTIQVPGNGYDRTVYFWILPAHVGGTWQSEAGTQRSPLQITQQFQEISGTFNNAAVTNAELVGDQISFTAGPATYNGRVDGHTITGTVKDAAGERVWRATRNPENLPNIEGDATDEREEERV